MWYKRMIVCFGHVQKFNIDKVINYFKEDGSSCNWEHSKGDTVSEFLGIDINTLDNDRFKFY